MCLSFPVTFEEVDEFSCHGAFYVLPHVPLVSCLLWLFVMENHNVSEWKVLVKEQ
jgi:hypothetical protein